MTKRIIPAALIVGAASVGAYGIATGKVTEMLGKGLDAVGNPSDAVHEFFREPPEHERAGRRDLNLLPDEQSPSPSSTENDTAAEVRAGAYRPDAARDDVLSEQRAPGPHYLDGLSQRGTAAVRPEVMDEESPLPAPATAPPPQEEVATVSEPGAQSRYQLDLGAPRSSMGEHDEGPASYEMDTVEDQDAFDVSRGQTIDGSEKAIEPDDMQRALDDLLTQRDDEGEAEFAGTTGQESDPGSADQRPSAHLRNSPAVAETIQAIGRRVGEAWHYDGEDYLDHGAVVRVRLGEDTSPRTVTVVRSSGDTTYEAAALNAARSSAPFVEIGELDPEARTMMTEFSLTFGSMAAIEAWEAEWAVQESVPTAPQPKEDTSYYGEVLRTIEKEWLLVRPSELPDRHEITVEVKLAVPFGNVLGIDFLRPSAEEAVNDSIQLAIRSAGPFGGIRQLPLSEQQELREFRLTFTEEGVR